MLTANFSGRPRGACPVGGANAMSDFKLAQNRIQVAIIVLALLGSAWFLSGLVALLLSQPTGTGIQQEALRPLPQPARFAWFPRETAAPVQNIQPEESTELSDATINAELLGVVIQGDRAVASISLPRNPNGVYEVGDEISPGVSLERIEPLRVVVSERGSLRQIPLKPVVTSRTANRSQLLETVASEPSGFNLSGVLGATPIQIAGAGLGIRLDSLDDEISQISDLRVRDVILSVDGTPVSQLMTSPQRWQQLMMESTVTLDIQRDGVDQQITVNARSLGERILPTLGQGLVQ